MDAAARPPLPQQTLPPDSPNMALNGCGLLLFLLYPSQLKFKLGQNPEAPVLRGLWIGREFKQAMEQNPGCAEEYRKVKSMLKLGWLCGILAWFALSALGLLWFQEKAILAKYPLAATLDLMLCLLLIGAMQLLSQDLYGAIRRLVGRYNAVPKV